MKRGFGRVWSIVSYPVLYIGMQILVSVLYFIGLGVSIGLDLSVSYAADLPENILDIVLERMNLMIPVVFGAVATLVIVCLRMRPTWKESGFWDLSRLKRTPLLLCVLLGVGLNWFTVGAISLSGLTEIFPEYEEIMIRVVGNSLPLDVLGVAILGPVAEEIIFRGIVFDRLKETVKIRRAMFTQAVLFGVIHMNILQSLYAALVGMALCLALVWFDSIYAAIAAHVAYNLTAVVMTYAIGSRVLGFGQMVAVTLAGLGISVLVMIMMSGRTKPGGDI